MEMGKTMAELFIEKFGKEIAEKVLDEYEYKGKTIREWADLLSNGDVVEVVRCKDCMWARIRYGKLECVQGVSYRNSYNDPNMFCNYGERKEE